MPRSHIAPLPVLIAVSILVLCAPASVQAQPEAMGPGAGWFDCNNDDYLDLCYLRPNGEIFLLVFDPPRDEYVDHSAAAFPGARFFPFVGEKII